MESGAWELLRPFQRLCTEKTLPALTARHYGAVRTSVLSRGCGGALRKFLSHSTAGRKLLCEASCLP